MTQPHRRVTHLRNVEEKHELLAKHGIIMLDGEIDEAIAYMFCMDTLYSSLAGFFKGRRLLVVLNSPGGSVEHGLAIYDCIRALVASGTEVDVMGLGLVASMGTVIIQAGTRRLATPHTQFLVHQISRTIGFFQSEEVSQLTEKSTELNRLNDIVMGIIATRSGVSSELLKMQCHKTDYWMDPVAARKLGTSGLIDEITDTPLTRILAEAQQ